MVEACENSFTIFSDVLWSLAGTNMGYIPDGFANLAELSFLQCLNVQYTALLCAIQCS
jgi:hypothetical protein